jgi:hypothetical protein
MLDDKSDVPVSVVVGIDLGTAASGVAYAFVKAPDKIECDQMLCSGSSLKTRTAVLLSPDGKFVAFGDAALRMYLQLQPEEQRDYLFFDHFKMALYSEDALAPAKHPIPAPASAPPAAAASTAGASLDSSAASASDRAVRSKAAECELALCSQNAPAPSAAPASAAGVDRAVSAKAERGVDGSAPLAYASNGRTWPLVEVLAHALRFLKEHALQRLRSASANAVRFADIRWVVTVPAIWTERAKSLVRAAASLAGFDADPVSPSPPNASPSTSASTSASTSPASASAAAAAAAAGGGRRGAGRQQKFMLALESEAAALRCRRDEAGLHDALRSEGARLVAVDLGGGTADIAAHVVRKDSRVDEVRPSDGNDCGSWRVDRAFFHWLEDALGVDRLKRYRADEPADFLELRAAFQDAKHGALESVLRPDPPAASASPAASAAGVGAPPRLAVGDAVMTAFGRGTVAGHRLADDMYCVQFGFGSGYLSRESIKGIGPGPARLLDAGLTGPHFQVKVPHSFAVEFFRAAAHNPNANVTVWPLADPAPAPVAAAGLNTASGASTAGDLKHGVQASARPVRAVGSAAEFADRPWLDVDRLNKLADEWSPLKEDERERSWSKDDVRALYRRGHLRLSRALMFSLFAPLLSELVPTVQSMVVESKASHLFVVGGFAENELVWHVLQSLSQRLKVTAIRPARPSMAVLTGAVMFGLEPSIIQNRVVKRTYGVSVSCEWNEKKHLDRKKSRRPNNGQMVAYCDGIFSPFVLAGDIVHLDKAVTQTYTPGEDHQECMVLKIYQSTSRNVTYIDAPDASLVAVITLPMPDIHANGTGLQRKADVSMYFGATEIRVRAINNSSGDECEARLAFIDRSLAGNFSLTTSA